MKRKSRERGSAIILAILLLSFFMALSLNMFFIAQKKSERAGIKAKGVKVLSTIDGGAAIAYYELRKASDYVTRGIDLRTREVEETTATGTAVRTGPIADINGNQYFTITRPNVNGTPIWGVQGVVLDNYNQFMSSRISASATQAAIYIPAGNNAESSIAAALYVSTAIAAVYSSNAATTEDWRRKSDLERIWTITPAADDSDMSIGGYQIVPDSLTFNGTPVTRITTLGNAGDTVEINVQYEKYLRIAGGTNIGDLSYQITCDEILEYTLDSSGEIIGDTIENDIENMTIEGK